MLVSSDGVAILKLVNMFAREKEQIEYLYVANVALKKSINLSILDCSWTVGDLGCRLIGVGDDSPLRGGLGGHLQQNLVSTSNSNCCLLALSTKHLLVLDQLFKADVGASTDNKDNIGVLVQLGENVGKKCWSVGDTQ